MEGMTTEPGYYPDGLTESVIDALIEEAFSQVSTPSATSALLDGTAAERRRRRMARRSWAAVVRALPAGESVSGLIERGAA